MAHLKARNTPASAPGGLTWDDPEHIVEVPDHLATELLRIAGQFSEVLPTDPEHPHYGDTPEQLEPEIDPADLIGEVTPNKCHHEGCNGTPKKGQDFCHWHKPKP